MEGGPRGNAERRGERSKLGGIQPSASADLGPKRREWRPESFQPLWLAEQTRGKPGPRISGCGARDGLHKIPEVVDRVHHVRILLDDVGESLRVDQRHRQLLVKRVVV